MFGYRIYSITDIAFNDATPLLTYKAIDNIYDKATEKTYEKTKLSLVVYVS